MSQLQDYSTPAANRQPEDKLSCSKQSLLLVGEETFCRDLPELLKSHEGKWVAYRGAQRLGLAESSTSLYREYVAQGLDPKELFVELIHPEAGSNQFSFTWPQPV